MDGKKPQNENYQTEISEIKRKIRHYETKLSSVMFDLDMGLLGKTNAEYYTNKLNELNHEMSELDSKVHRQYSKEDVDCLKSSINHHERHLYSMKHDQELIGTPYANRISFEDYKINYLKQELKKAQKSQG